MVVQEVLETQEAQGAQGAQEAQVAKKMGCVHTGEDLGPGPFPWSVLPRSEKTCCSPYLIPIQSLFNPYSIPI